MEGEKKGKKNNNKKKLDLRKISRIRNGVNAGKKKNLKTSFAAEYLWREVLQTIRTTH